MIGRRLFSSITILSSLICFAQGEEDFGKLCEYFKNDSSTYILTSKRDPLIRKVYFISKIDEQSFAVNPEFGNYQGLVQYSTYRLIQSESAEYCIKEGQELLFRSNNTLYASISYKDGMWDGPFIYYNDEGGISEMMHYRKDTLYGEYIRFHKNGNVNTIGHYYKGIEKGVWKYFNEKGQLILTGNYSGVVYSCVFKEDGVYYIYKNSVKDYIFKVVPNKTREFHEKLYENRYWNVLYEGYARDVVLNIPVRQGQWTYFRNGIPYKTESFEGTFEEFLKLLKLSE